MSIIHSIRILLNLKYEKNNIDYLFQKFLENNIRLYKDSFDKLNELDSRNAAARVLSIKLEPEDRCVDAKFQNTDFSILTYKEKNNLISFSVSCFDIEWKKEFINDDYGIDFARYIHLLLRVCRDFTILELKTSTF